MRWSAVLVLPFFPLSVLAGKFHESPRSRHPRHARSIQARNNTGSPKFTLTDLYQGQSFLNDWDFFSDEDPTHGNVNYQTRDNAIQKGLAFVQADGTTVLKVDNFSNVGVGGNRDSVWPAYWSVGPNWPAGGEIDVLEGVHDQKANQYTLHTSTGCEIGPTVGKTTALSSILNDQCASSGTDNRGCGFLDPDDQTYGHQFNLLAGGVYAHLWDSTGNQNLAVPQAFDPCRHHSKDSRSLYLGHPAAFFPATNCDMASHFFDHTLVIDTTICGDFGGPTYATSGCPGTCAQAVANSTNFDFAKWQINYIAVYDPSS
ncbi:glycoside hydrolase family 16 protein [Pholiota molesta]|nr:glycoside hydrolase family 16 protein [Pholiota molesta]